MLLEVKKKQQNKKSQIDETDVSDLCCPGCGDLYSESNEEWIICSECTNWWHESCTTGGSFPQIGC